MEERSAAAPAPLPRALRWGVPLAIVLVIWSLTTHGKYSVSGDEPHYLMVAESLLSDGDLDLQNNYASDDGRKFGHDHLEMGLHARRTRFGTYWSSHDIGVPVLLLPVYAVATHVAAWSPVSVLARFRMTQGLFAYSIISLALIVATAWGAMQLLDGLRRVAPAAHAVAVELLVVLSPPVLSHAFLIFPETFAFVAVCFGVSVILAHDSDLRVGRAMALAGVVGCLPWLHRKFSFLAIGLLVVFVWRHRRWLTRRAAGTRVSLALLFVVPQVALHAWTFWAWGTFGGPQMLQRLPFSVGGFERGVVGLFCDREYGLLADAPIYLLLPAWWWLARRESAILLWPVLLLYLPMAAYAEWWAGFSPAARYLVPLVPLCAVSAARALAWRPVRWAVAGLGVLQIPLTAFLWRYPRTLWPDDSGVNRALRAVPFVGVSYERFLPSIRWSSLSSHAVACLAAILLLNVLLVVAVRLDARRQETSLDR